MFFSLSHSEADFDHKTQAFCQCVLIARFTERLPGWLQFPNDDSNSPAEVEEAAGCGGDQEAAAAQIQAVDAVKRLVML